ncbi:MAG: 7TM diverse intracellular signaling domain-containing protein [Bacteroidota bacterium]
MNIGFFIVFFSTLFAESEAINNQHLPEVDTYGGSPILLDDAEVHCLNDYAVFLSVYDQHLTAKEALAKKDAFLPWKETSISSKEKEVWVLLTLRNETDYPRTFYLNGQLTDYVDLYQILDDQPELITKSGYLLPFEDRAILDWGTVVSSSIEAQTHQAYLLRLKSVTKNSQRLMSYALPGCMKLFTQSGYEETYRLPRILNYFFLGAIFIMFIYNFCISLITLYKEYFLFSVYNIATVLTFLFLSGSHLEIGLTQPIDWIRNFQYICFAGVFLSYFLFSAKYLDLKVNMPRTYKVLRWVPLLYLVIGVGLILSYYIFALRLIIIAGIGSFLIIWYCSIRLSLKITSARFLLGGNMVISMVGLFNLFNLQGWIKTSEMMYVSYSVQMVEVVIFSFAVAYKLKVSKRAMHQYRHQNEIQKERLITEEAMRKQLEIDVNEKSRSLTATSIQLLSFSDKLSEIIEKVKFDVRAGNDPWEYVVKELDSLKNTDNYWASIKTHFENVHPDFFSKLEHAFPNLTPNDHKLLAFVKMKLSNKEIAIIMNVSRRAVEQAKRRVKKKMQMNSDDTDIIGFIEKIPSQQEK